MPRSRPTVIVASHNPELAHIRKRLLEQAGFSVLPATGAVDVEKLCRENNVRLIMLGYSVPPAQKRHIWHTVRKHCNAPILELHKKGKPELLEQNVFGHEAHRADDFVDRVHEILKSH